MRIPSGKVDQAIYFIALSSADLATRLTGLTTFTVYRSRNNGAATLYTTPTVTELSAANMPGVYSLLIDEDTTIASTSDSEEYCVHITQASMAPVSRTIELYRRDTTSGNTAAVDSGGAMTLTTTERNAVADALLDRADAIETGITLRQAIRGKVAMLFGVVTGAQSGTEVFKNPAGTTTRATITDDSSGNRSSIALNL